MDSSTPQMQLTAKSVLFGSAHNLRLSQTWERMWAGPVCMFLWIFTEEPPLLTWPSTGANKHLLFWHSMVPEAAPATWAVVGAVALRLHLQTGTLLRVRKGCCYPSSLSGSFTPRLPGASFPSADRVAALLLLASEAWVGVSRRLRTPPSTVLDGGLRATRPE